jgi:hypothetical protein
MLEIILFRGMFSNTLGTLIKWLRHGIRNNVMTVLIDSILFYVFSLRWYQTTFLDLQNVANSMLLNIQTFDDIKLLKEAA